MYDPYADFTKTVLSNGLEIHSIYWDRPWIGVMFIVHAGGREDPVTMPGLAHFVEHLVSENIPKKDLNLVEEFFENCGGSVGLGETRYLSTQYHFRIPADPVIFQEAIEIFGSMLLEEQIEKCVERERNIILREFNMGYPFQETLEWDMCIRKSLFVGHRLETWNRPIGRPEGFLLATKEDLQAFYDKYYVPANISLVVVGGLKIEEIISQLESSPFGKQKNGTRNFIPQPFNQIVIPKEKLKEIKLSDCVSFKSDQTIYKATWAFPVSFPSKVSGIFTLMLRDVLFDEIRKKRGLAYSIGAYCTSFQDVCEYEISASINPGTTLDIDKLVHQCIEVVPRKRDLFDRKIRRSKQKCLMIDVSGLDLSVNSAKDLASHYRIISTQEDFDDIGKVTFEQMSEVAEILNHERQYTLLAFP